MSSDYNINDSIYLLGNISERTSKALYKNNILYIKQILKPEILIKNVGTEGYLCSDNDIALKLWRLKGIGRKAINELKYAINNKTISFLETN